MNNIPQILELPLAIQTALGAGYLSYSTAYAGYRREHGAQDAVFITLSFSVVALLLFSAFEERGAWVASGASFAGTLFISVLWRVAGRKLWQGSMSGLRVHRDDGGHAAWLQIVQTTREVGQISVHTKDGRTLYLNDRTKFDDAPWSGLYLGNDGSVVMIVEEEEFSDGRIEVRQGVRDPAWGDRLTYLPATEICRVNVRMK